jgi:MFS transporter, PHS family, inorganic phosphate transporter
MSASIVSERGHLNHRGALLGLIFSNQGWGTLAGSIVTIIILACFEPALNVRGEYGQLDAVWRIQMGLALVPALIVLPFRLTMPEGKKFLESQELNYSTSMSTLETEHEPAPLDATASRDAAVQNDGILLGSPGVQTGQTPVLSEPQTRKAKWDTFIVYFRQWRHLKILLGTALSWFLVDIAFYGTNLNQSVILADIGFSTGRNEYHVLMRNALGNLIIAVAGYVPGYFVTVALVEILGRKWIQIQGFLVCALMFGILAGDYNRLSTAGRFVLFALAQVSSPALFFPSTRLMQGQVLFQLWSKCYHLHYSCGGFPFSSPSIGTRRLCCNRQGRRHPCGTSV